jgi:DNA-binding transcriptional MerR regulator
MDDILDISDVCRRTGLTSRALRFYEARGLLQPLRTGKGRRFYDAAQLERLHRILMMKRAGFTLSQIALVLGRMPPPLAEIIDAQIAVLEAQRAEVSNAIRLMRAARLRIADGARLDSGELCHLIRIGENDMQAETMKQVAARYLTDEDQARWSAAKDRLRQTVDEDAYQADWAELVGRIEAALPLDPASGRAQALLADWRRLLAPFNAVADDRMREQTRALYDRMDEWSAEVTPPFSKDVWTFIKAAEAAATI